MRGDNRLTCFACDNGDTILIEAHRKTILTDINYRKAGAEDEDNDDVPDFAPDLRSACGDHLDLFVLTHPDVDHLRGIDHIFHLGSPSTLDSNPKVGEPKILIDEIWCSSYGANPNYVTDEAEPFINEIKRRKALHGTAAANVAGNKLRVLSASTDTAGVFAAGIEWRLHAPTSTEAAIPKAAPGEPQNSSNASSLVIRWNIKINGSENLVLLGGDTTVEVLERLGRQTQPKDPDSLAWHILVAVHHCSRRAIGRVEHEGKDEEYIHSPDAEKALSEQRNTGFVVSSSKRIIVGAATPPSSHARTRYYKILANGGEVTSSEKNRFFCTGGDSASDKSAHVIFEFGNGGPSRLWNPKSSAAILGGVGSAVGRGGGYGRS